MRGETRGRSPLLCSEIFLSFSQISAVLLSSDSMADVEGGALYLYLDSRYIKNATSN